MAKRRPKGGSRKREPTLSELHVRWGIDTVELRKLKKSQLEAIYSEHHPRMFDEKVKEKLRGITTRLSSHRKSVATHAFLQMQTTEYLNDYYRSHKRHNTV